MQKESALLILCEQTPGELNLSSISRETSINTRTLHNYLTALNNGELIKLIYHSKKGHSLFQKPDKILLANPNLFKSLCFSSNTGSLRESFFISSLYNNDIRYLKSGGDYLINNTYTFEIGGKNKNFKQIKNKKDSYLAIDNIEIGEERKIPLWMFGFLY